MNKPSLLDPKFRYVSAQASSEPGYLARKFAKLQRQQREAQSAASNVRQLKSKGGK